VLILFNEFSAAVALDVLTMSFANWTISFSPRRFSRRGGFLLGLALAAACIGPRPAAAGFRENFESPETSWSFAAADAAYRVQQHRRLQTQAHWGHGCEQLRIACGLGTHVYFGHEIGRARVIDELEASVWVKADRPGIQLLARVVFPRAVDPATGEPVTALLQGTKYTSPGGWQRLTLDDAPQRCAEQARVLRLQLQQDVDVREAYLDLLVLNTYSSAGVTNILIDDLEIDGYLPVPQHAAQQQTVQQAAWQTASDATSAPHRPAAQEAAGAQRTDVPAGPGDDRFFGTTSSGGDDRGRHRIELRGAVMLIDGQPFFPRIIEHRGESYDAAWQHYRDSLLWSGFCGGGASKSRWLTRDSLLKAIDHSGFRNREINFDEPDHPHGPALAICAWK